MDYESMWKWLKLKLYEARDKEAAKNDVVNMLSKAIFDCVLNNMHNFETCECFNDMLTEEELKVIEQKLLKYVKYE